MEGKVFLELQATVRCGKRLVSGEGLWFVGPDGSVLLSLAQSVGTALMMSASQYLDSMEFRVDLVLATLLLTGPYAKACEEACQLLAADNPERISWREGRHSYDRKGVRVG